MHSGATISNHAVAKAHNSRSNGLINKSNHFIQNGNAFNHSNSLNDSAHNRENGFNNLSNNSHNSDLYSSRKRSLGRVPDIESTDPKRGVKTTSSRPAPFVQFNVPHSSRSRKDSIRKLTAASFNRSVDDDSPVNPFSRGHVRSRGSVSSARDIVLNPRFIDDNPLTELKNIRDLEEDYSSDSSYSGKGRNNEVISPNGKCIVELEKDPPSNNSVVLNGFSRTNHDIGFGQRRALLINDSQNQTDAAEIHGSGNQKPSAQKWRGVVKEEEMTTMSQQNEDNDNNGNNHHNDDNAEDDYDDEKRKKAMLLLWSLNAWNVRKGPGQGDVTADVARGRLGSAGSGIRGRRSGRAGSAVLLYDADGKMLLRSGTALRTCRGFDRSSRRSALCTSNGHNMADPSTLLGGPGRGSQGKGSGERREDEESLTASCTALVVQVREASNEAEHCCEFINKTLDIISSTCLVTMLLSISLILPLGMFIVGIKYLDSCPVQPKIPIYLLVGGGFGMLKIFTALWQHVRSRRFENSDDISDDDYDNKDGRDGATGVVMATRSSRISELTLSVFLITWFAFGNYWTFGVYRPNFQQPLSEPNAWCDKTVYIFSVVQIIICYVIIVIIFAVLMMLTICYKTEPSVELR